MQPKGPEGGRGEQKVSHSGSEWETPGCSLKMESVTSHKDGQLLGAGRSRKTCSPKAPKAEFRFGPGRFLLNVQPREQWIGDFVLFEAAITTVGNTSGSCCLPGTARMSASASPSPTRRLE